MGMATDELFFKPTLKVISDDQIARLHDATLEVLERTGFKITHSRALEVLAGSGARVQGDRVRLPAWMVEDASRQAPARSSLSTTASSGASTAWERGVGVLRFERLLVSWTASENDLDE